VASAEGGASRGGGARRTERGNRGREPARGEGRPRNRRRGPEESEDLRTARGSAARDYYAIFDEDEFENEPVPTTAEELVARFNRDRR
jgi:hypothetical protein